MRYLSIILAGLLLFAGVALAEFPAYDSIIVLSGPADQTHPPCYVKRVRYADEGLSKQPLGSGCVVSWDNISADGITISACTIATAHPVGVLVTTALTQDQGGSAYLQDDNYAYMCVEGYCLASMDTSEIAGVGNRLVLTDQCSIGVGLSSFGSAELSSIANVSSADCGIVLSKPAGDTQGAVMLRLR